MCIGSLLTSKNMTTYRLAKLSGVPHTTVFDIYSGKTQLSRCTFDTLYKLSMALGMTMEELVTGELKYRNETKNEIKEELITV